MSDAAQRKEVAKIAGALQVFTLQMAPIYESVKRLADLSEADFLQAVIEDGSIVTSLSDVTSEALTDLWKVVFEGIPTGPPIRTHGEQA